MILCGNCTHTVANESELKVGRVYEGDAKIERLALVCPVCESDEYLQEIDDEQEPEPKVNRYVNDNFLKIGLCIRNNQPVNDYPQDMVRVKLHHINGETNWFSISDEALVKIHRILSEDE